MLERFQGISPINRKFKQRVGTDLAGPPRTTLVIDYLGFERPFFETWPPETHIWLLPSATEPERDRAKKAITSFMARAYRRPVFDADVIRVLWFYDQIRPTSISFEETMDVRTH